MSENINKKIESYLLEIIFKNKKTLLPSENFLATKFKTSRQTARIELLKLLNKGFIRVKKGSGYYINPHIKAIKLASVGESYKWNKRDIFEIKDKCNYIEKILMECSIAIHDNFENYYGYRKVFYNNLGKPEIYVNSFILKTAVKDINIEKISNSLLNFFYDNNIEIDYQVNNVKLENLNDFDIEIFGNKQPITPTIYGVIFSKDDKILEIYERRYTIESFKPSFVKHF